MRTPQRTHAFMCARVSVATKQFLRTARLCSARIVQVISVVSISIADRRRAQRVQFSRGVTTYIMAIDGTWRRSCIMEDVSSTGAKLTIEGSIEGLKLTKFFLV